MEHLLSINVEKAKNRIKKLQNQIVELQSFVDNAESYNPKSFEEKVIKEYAYSGSVLKTMEKLNSVQLTSEQGKKIMQNDIRSVLDSKPLDDLHKHVRKIYLSNKKNTKAKKISF